ncbi:hypothetical protein E6Q11_04455 [Candidatus Dojkabacteria bacterium]|uniref:DUF5660 domain-containing protein n=1 Tax=Candidatus Dojkabacteria bacterium TaxID=2099670 RepID=A0A5C7J4P8_9BACT|nr:MAG: hypothetical protein E6Q11_04455 [Candidatus Dojkabacteria bacterium]
MKPTKPKEQHKPAPQLVDESFMEQMQGIGKGFMDSVTDDLAKAAPDVLAQQVVGKEPSSHSSHGEMKAGQEVDLSHGGDHGKNEGHADEHGESHAGGHHAATEIGHHYQQEIAHAGAEVAHEQAQERAGEYHHALSELAGMAHGNEQLENVVANAEQQNAQGTVQELSWVERVLAGEKMKVDIEDSGSWMGALGRKNGKDYWTQAKNKGTSFTQSNERSVATQVG